MAKTVKGLKLQDLMSVAVRRYDVINGENLKSVSSAHIRNHRIFEVRLIQKDGLRGQGEQIDDGRTPQTQSLGRDIQLEHLAALGAFETGDQKDNLDSRPETSFLQCLESVKVQKKELFREREIFLQETVTREGMPRIGQERLIILESNRAQGTCREHDRQFPRIGCQVADQNLRATVAEQLVKGVNEIAFAIQMEPQRPHLHLAEIGVGQAADLNTQRGGSLRSLDRGPQPVRREPLSFYDREGPEGGVVTRSEFAGVAFDWSGIEHRTAGNRQPAGEFSLFRIQVKLHHGHRGNRPDVMRIKNGEKGFRDFRKFIVNFQVDARSQERGRFNQSFHVGIFTTIGLQKQA